MKSKPVLKQSIKQMSATSQRKEWLSSEHRLESRANEQRFGKLLPIIVPQLSGYAFHLWLQIFRSSFSVTFLWTMDAIKYFETRNKTFNETQVDEELPRLEALEFWPYQVILIVLYSTTAFISLTSNMITIVVLIKGDRISSELWKYLVNLSVSDIVLSLLSIPFTYTSYMLNQWIFPTQLCPVVNFAQTCSVFVTVWTLTVIGIDRWAMKSIY